MIVKKNKTGDQTNKENIELLNRNFHFQANIPDKKRGESLVKFMRLKIIMEFNLALSYVKVGSQKCDGKFPRFFLVFRDMSL